VKDGVGSSGEVGRGEMPVKKWGEVKRKKDGLREWVERMLTSKEGRSRVWMSEGGPQTGFYHTYLRGVAQGRVWSRSG
jgi:hypothetical protein